MKKMKAAEMLKMKLGASRRSQKEQGFFDGRFVQRSEISKKIYNRKKEKEKRRHTD